MRHPLLSALAIGLTLTTLAGSALAQDDLLELRLATAENDINPTTDSVLKFAASMGYYEKHGLKVTIVSLDGTPQAAAALNSGAVDLADIGIDAAIRLRADNDVPIRGIVAGTLGAPYLIAGKDDIASINDLPGRSFAIADNGSLDHNLTQVVLTAMGVPADELNYVAIGAPAARVQALAAGKVDATTVSYGTFLPIADTPGIKILVQPEDFSAESPGLSKFVAVLDSTIETKHEALQRFVDALVDISRHFHANPDEWVDAVAAVREDLSRDNLDKTATFLAGRWCVNGCMNAHELDKTVAFVYANPDFKDVKPVTAADIVDHTFIARTLETMGADPDPGLDKP